MSRIWAQAQNGQIEVVQMTEETLKMSIDSMKTFYFQEELLSICFDVSSSEESMNELAKVEEEVTEDGISLVAIDRATNKLAGFIFNKIIPESKDQEITNNYEEFITKCKTQTTKKFMEYELSLYDDVELYSILNATCLVEMYVLAVVPEYRNKSVSIALVEGTIELIKTLQKGENCKQQIGNKPLVLEDAVPDGLYCLATTIKTRNLVKKFNFDTLKIINYKDCFYNGNCFYNKVGHVTDCMTIEALKI